MGTMKLQTFDVDRMRERAQAARDASAARDAARQRAEFLATPLGQWCQGMHDALAAFGARLAPPHA